MRRETSSACQCSNRRIDQYGKENIILKRTARFRSFNGQSLQDR